MTLPRLDPVAESCLLQAWWRACETDGEAPLLEDEPAQRFVRDFVSEEMAARFAQSAMNAVGHEIHVQSVRVSDCALAAWAHAHPEGQIVILGSGLDGRPLRHGPTAGHRYFCVDRSEVLDLASTHLARDGLTMVPGNLARSDDVLGRLALAGLETEGPVTWICEGVVEFLGTRGSAVLFDHLARVSGPDAMILIQALTPRFIGRANTLGGASWKRLPEPDAILEPLRAWQIDDLSEDFIPRGTDVEGLVQVFRSGKP